jgi:hypothetical protein
MRRFVELQLAPGVEPPPPPPGPGRSNPDYFGAMASRLGELFADYTLDVFEQRHHFDPRTVRNPSASRPGCESFGSAPRPDSGA